jgi:hypothetical protein
MVADIRVRLSSGSTAVAMARWTAEQASGDAWRDAWRAGDAIERDAFERDAVKRDAAERDFCETDIDPPIDR